jgi:hypothetical protein
MAIEATVGARARLAPPAVGFVASIGVGLTSLDRGWWPLLGVIWAAGFVLTVIIERGDRLFTALALMTKPATIALIVLSFTSSYGPHTALDWVPLGSLNAVTTLWLVNLVRRRR